MDSAGSSGTMVVSMLHAPLLFNGATSAWRYNLATVNCIGKHTSLFISRCSLKDNAGT